MEYIYLLFLIGCPCLLVQMSLSGKLHDKDKVISNQRAQLLDNLSVEEELRKEIMSLRTAMKHYESEISRLEKLTHG